MATAGPQDKIKAKVDISAEIDADEDPMKDPRVRAQVDLARGAAFHLLKAIKQIGLYRHNESKFGEYLQKTCDAINDYCAQHGPLNIKVDMTNLLLFKQELFTDENPLSYKFFKDGIRTLIFRPGITTEELVTFTLIALSDPDRGAEDINAQLWKAQLKHLEYIMVEGFRMDEFSEEEIQVEVDKVIDYLQRRLRANSDDYLRFARITAEDLELKLDGIEQMRGLVVTGITATPEYKARMQRDVNEEETQRLFPKLISAVFQVVESGVDDPQLLEEMFLQLLDAMLLQEDFTTIGQVVLKLRAMVQRQGDDSPMGQLLKVFVAKMGEEQRLSRIGDILKTTRPKNPADITRYLSELDHSVGPMLLDVLDTIELPENRQLMVEVLVAFAKRTPEIFVERLKSDRPQTVRDIIQILDRSNHPNKLKFFTEMLKSKNLAMKLEVISIIGKGRSGEARAIIAGVLDDPNKQMRMTAARVLPDFDREKGYLDLIRVVKDPAFHKKDAEEQEALYVALGSTNMPGAIGYFQDLLKTKPGMFNKAKVIEEKLHAIHGMVGACTLQTFKALTELCEDKTQPPEIQSAAMLGMLKTKKMLFGSGDAPGQGGHPAHG